MFLIESYRSISKLIEFDKINFGFIMPRSVSTGNYTSHFGWLPPEEKNVKTFM
jgi:hypothetical protein